LPVQTHYLDSYVSSAGFRSPAGLTKVKMFARKVAIRLKSDALPEFINVIEGEILPWLRKRQGFVDLIIFAMRGSNEVATISFWEREADAETWAAEGFPEATKTLEKIIEGPSYVKTFDVVSSTIHENARLRKVRQNNLEEDSSNCFPPTPEMPEPGFTM
jgi:heme-degrading monooxygenase HmoA